jgi:hypothetical protein
VVHHEILICGTHLLALCERSANHGRAVAPSFLANDAFAPHPRRIRFGDGVFFFDETDSTLLPVMAEF